MTGQEKEKLANVGTGAQVNVIEKVQKNGTDLSISNKTVNVPVGTGMLKTKIGSAQSATDLFGADSSTDATLEIPMASADTTGAEPVYTEGLMSGQDKEKLDGIEAGAEANVKPDWSAEAGSDEEILNKPVMISLNPDSYITITESGGLVNIGLNAHTGNYEV